ncbi:serine/threonine protein kinase [Neosynechococcus sphagnicola sy1]|uniref:Serine/threonine protein kinase n=1 Tax=Neosynechococcus sphagnicola sy1 TaxID=1497020 RepID=A0A098TJK9_9CYAN|nr:AAA-like domain-containing protein [Neosynechococcus sphagnicola]KGF72444.1 serine/threonine protein kinase [Neosynechococcus sphagnicola sy1]
MQSQSRNHGRRRGVTLTARGSRKLNQAKANAEIEHNFKYTLESLSEETGLTSTTLSKIFTGSAGVDKRTLKCCFAAFNLTLLTEDYLYLKPAPNTIAEIGSGQAPEAFFNLDPDCDSPSEMLREPRNTPQTHNMDRRQDKLQPRLPTTPGGQMPLSSVFYIDRPILESLCYEAIQQPGALLNIRAPKQMGKTSLMTRILAYANTQGSLTVSLSLQLADAEILQSLESFLKWFCARVSRQLGVSNAIADFWDHSLGGKSNATDYFEDVLLTNLACLLVMAIDELNQLFAYPDIAREFLLLLRTWSKLAKARVPDRNPWFKLRLVTVYSTEILMPLSINPALLNTGVVINLPEFTTAQVQDLSERCGQEITARQIKQLITLLGGHPYRLQLAFYHLQQQTITLEVLLENSEVDLAIYAEHLQQQWWNLQRYPDLWTVFTQIVRQLDPVDCGAEEGSQLQQLGLVHLQGFQASLACELFRPFFRKRLPDPII